MISHCCDGQSETRYIYVPNGQNHPAYSFNGCSALCFSTRALAVPDASGWRSASGGGIVMFLILAKAWILGHSQLRYCCTLAKDKGATAG